MQEGGRGLLHPDAVLQEAVTCVVINFAYCLYGLSYVRVENAFHSNQEHLDPYFFGDTQGTVVPCI